MTAGDVYRALWRHKYLIVVLTAACVAVTWYVTSRQAKEYKASTLVRVQERGASSSFSSLSESVAVAETYAKIIGSGALNTAAKVSLNGRVKASLISNVELSAEPVPDLALIWISARGRHPAGVAAIANAAPGVLRAATGQFGTPGDEIITVKRAGLPSDPVSPDLTLNVVLALVLGLMFNGGLALLFEVLRDRLPDPDELEDSLGYPVLATIPVLRLKPIDAASESLFAGDAPDSERTPLAGSGTVSGLHSEGDGSR